MIDYTLVCGVDEKHLQQLSWVWPTWVRYKPSLLERPIIIFYDKQQITKKQLYELWENYSNITFVPWPPVGVEYEGGDDKWTNPQRYKMLAGFVYVPAQYCQTRYWLKLDTDTVATGQDDWIDPKWFEDSPAIVSHPWSFTKPPNQMLMLDRWVKENRSELRILDTQPPLDLKPNIGAQRLGHKRIISWCAFFSTSFTVTCSSLAHSVCGEGKLPVPSQDGYMWYCAKRLGLTIRRQQMKGLGWEHWSSNFNVRRRSEEVMNVP